MSKAKKYAQEQAAFWSSFIYVNLPKGTMEVPTYVHRVNFKLSSITDVQLLWMTDHVRSIDQLDLDETDITSEGIAHLTRLESLKELRLKGCINIGNESVPYLYQLTSLELLHLHDTGITMDALQGIGVLSNLKMLLVSAPERAEEELTNIAIQLPADCELIVNHRLFELPGLY